MSEIWNLSTICRCCHSDGNFRSLREPYGMGDDIEIYESMLKDVFSIAIFQINTARFEASYTICEECIQKLKNAVSFKRQVLECEEKFDVYCRNEQFILPHIIEDVVKTEPIDSTKDEFDKEYSNTHVFPEGVGKGALQSAHTLPIHFGPNVIEGKPISEEDYTNNIDNEEKIAANLKNGYKIEVDIEIPNDDIENHFNVYCSDSEPESRGEPSTKRTRKGGHDWIFEKRFDNFEEARQFVQSENTWTVKLSHMTEEGKKQYYRCNKVKYRGPQCAALIYLLFESNSDAVFLYRKSSDHDHENIGSKRDYGMNQEIKDEINKLYALHLKPNAILKRLSEMKEIKVPSKKQLNNYLSDRRRSFYSPSTISLGELEQWLINKSQIPDDDNEPYVLYYHVYQSESPTFSFAIGTKSLLKLATLSTNLHADATYKLIWQGFPVLVVGTTDKAKRFHPLCMAISSSERKEDFEMLFDALKKGVFSLYSYNIEPKALICDASKSIQNAFQTVFGTEVTIKMCWARAKRNIQKSVEILVEKKKQKAILDDIDTLHSATSPTFFNRALVAFFDKYVQEQRFITYFKQEWVSLNPNWYLGSAEGSPVTNNALESFNKNIKDTLRERLSLPRFLTIATNMVKEWSENHRPETFLSVPLLELNDWTHAYQWTKSDREVLESEFEQNTYVVASSTASNIPFGQDWDTFDGYKKNAFAYWRVVLPTQKSAWMNGKCTCPHFFENYKCKHVIGLAIRLKYVTAPAEAKNVPIGQKRKRGRPARARPALIIE